MNRAQYAALQAASHLLDVAERLNKTPHSELLAAAESRDLVNMILRLRGIAARISPVQRRIRAAPALAPVTEPLR